MQDWTPERCGETDGTQTQEGGGGGREREGGLPQTGWGVLEAPPPQPAMLPGTPEGPRMLAAGGALAPQKAPGVPAWDMQPPTPHK